MESVVALIYITVPKPKTSMSGVQKNYLKFLGSTSLSSI